MNAKDTLDKVKTLLGIEVQLEERLLENGTRFEADAFESGREVFIISEDDERIAVPAGEYLMEDGMLLVVSEDGIIDEIKEAVEEEVEETVEAPVVEEVEAAEEADVADWKGMEIRIKNLEDAIADLKSRLSEKDEYSSDEVEDSSTEVENTEVELSEDVKPLKHNPEAKQKTDLHLYSQNRVKNTQDRVFDRLFNKN